MYYGYIRYDTITHTEEHNMSTLNVVEVKAGTEADGFDVSYRVKSPRVASTTAPRSTSRASPTRPS
jgi:hypothetical protein